MTPRLLAIADWHATKACAAYFAEDYDAYARHIWIADRLRKEVA